MKKNSKSSNKIITLVRQKQFNIAFKLLRNQLKGAQDDEIWVSLGSLCGSQGMRDECVKCYQLAIQLNPQYALAYSYLGKVYAELGDYRKL